VSERALVNAVVTRLRSAAVLNDPSGQKSGARIGGRPPPGFGQLYYAVHWAGTREAGGHTTVDYLDKLVSVTVTITARIGVMPDDRQGKVVTDATELLDLAEAVALPNVISGNYADVMNVANAAIAGFGVTTNGFVEPLVFQNMGPVVECDARWISARDASDVARIEVRFGGARILKLG
jgi:hypothetical protein